MPHALTGGPGYKANPTYDEFLRKHSAVYRRHSAASNAMDGDRRASQAALDEHAAAAAQAVQNVEAGRRGSLTVAGGGAATANSRKGSVAVASDVTRKDSIFGLESTAGTRMSEERRPSTSLASDLLHKIKGDHHK
ncbi:hypothetical protein A1O1_02140 [Capronia coronata CBS 617.96]|uniref:Uncharacterized protein n=1 Tax=Capronia coronata CBS 617.96 TaxID=1182541 RepID=W9YLG8_9EURO|nr:uncharacterized protein A1O1_02140 [Capronia coronata CBS 617.96]EXJ93747.1 hypothetical protein A1O1_02140 [Capronia coronata CBS 617.96]